MKKWIRFGIGLLCFHSLTAHAELTWSGFLTAAGAASNVRYMNTGVEPLYMEHIGKQINFEKDSVLGIELNKEFDEVVGVTGRIVAAGRRDWDVKATRAFIKYSPAEKWHWKLGRVPTDYLIHSEDVFESYQYHWIALPESVYDMIPFHYLDGINTGFKMQLFKRNLKVKAALGALSEHTRTPVSDIEHTYKLRQVVHLMGSYGNEVFKLQGSYSVGRLTWGPNLTNESVNVFINSLINNAVLGQDYQNYLTVDNERILYQAIGYSFNWKKVVSYAEYLRRKSSAAIIPNLNAWYIMLGVRHQNLVPYVTVARQRISDNETRRFPGTANMAALMPIPGGLGNTLDNTVQAIAEGIDGPAAGDQTSYTAGVRWNVIDAVSVKASIEHIHPDRRSTGLFNVHPHKSVNIYRVGVDATFSE